jgi:hypothetical protein
MLYNLHLNFSKELDQNDPLNIELYSGVYKIDQYKIKIRNKLVYLIELHYFEKFIFIKFYPKILENSDAKYKSIGMGLKISEIRKLIRTCSDLINRILKSNPLFNFAFFGQVYDKDDEKGRLISKRFELYKKQVATDFYSEKIKHLEFEMLNFYTISLKTEDEFNADISSFIEFVKFNPNKFQSFMTKKAWNLLHNVEV